MTMVPMTDFSGQFSAGALRAPGTVLSAPNRTKCMFRDELLLAYVGTHVVGGGVGEMWKTIRIITPRYRLWSSTT